MSLFCFYVTCIAFLQQIVESIAIESPVLARDNGEANIVMQTRTDIDNSASEEWGGTAERNWIVMLGSSGLVMGFLIVVVVLMVRRKGGKGSNWKEDDANSSTCDVICSVCCCCCEALA